MSDDKNNNEPNLEQLIKLRSKEFNNTYSKYGDTRYIASGENISLDITTTDSLIEEGLANDLIHKINIERKNIGLSITDKIIIYCPLTFSQNLIEKIKKETVASRLTWFNENLSHEFILWNVKFKIQKELN